MKGRRQKGIWVPLLVGLGGCVGGQTGDVGTSGPVCQCAVDSERGVIPTTPAALTEANHPAWGTVVDVVGAPTGFSGELTAEVSSELWEELGLPGPSGSGTTTVRLELTPTVTRLYPTRLTVPDKCDAGESYCDGKQVLVVTFETSLRLQALGDVYLGSGTATVPDGAAGIAIGLDFSKTPKAFHCDFTRAPTGVLGLICGVNL